jgi:Zn-dependent alcohol dehydrogenase
MAAWKLAPALAAGNSVVLKPAGETPASSMKLMEVVGDLLPDGVLNVVNGSSPEAGKPLAQSPELRRSIVESLGSGVTEVEVGDRVAVPWLGFACGTCGFCTTGWETLCEQQRNTGYSIDGGYAEYAAATAKYVAKVPAGVDPLDAAPLTCAGVTTYKGAKLSGARPASLVAVFGIGGLGHLALQYAKIFGASVVAVDVVDDKLRLARELGADYTVNALTEDPVQAIKDLGGADAAIAVAVAPKAFEQAYQSLRRGGRRVFVCPRITQSSCRSLRPSSTESRSSAQPWAPARTSMRCSGCTPRGALG